MKDKEIPWFHFWNPYSGLGGAILASIVIVTAVAFGIAILF